MANKAGYWGTQKIVYPGVVSKWGKAYVFMEDVDGTTYMVKLNEQGEPDFS